MFAYELDGAEGPHCLTFAKYGQGHVREGEQRVLLEPAGEAGWGRCWWSGAVSSGWVGGWVGAGWVRG